MGYAAKATTGGGGFLLFMGLDINGKITPDDVHGTTPDLWDRKWKRAVVTPVGHDYSMRSCSLHELLGLERYDMLARHIIEKGFDPRLTVTVDSVKMDFRINLPDGTQFARIAKRIRRRGGK